MPIGLIYCQWIINSVKKTNRIPKAEDIEYYDIADKII
jgi:hypothetical protein